MPNLPTSIRIALDRGVAIPAMPLALTANRRLDERGQRGLIRYYAASGAGGLAVGVHTTPFAIREVTLRAGVPTGAASGGSGYGRAGPEHIVAHDGLDLRDLVGDGPVPIAVALEHAPRCAGGEPIAQANVQESDAGRLPVLLFGYLDQDPLVGAYDDRNFAFRRDAVLGTAQPRVVDGARRNVARDAAAVYHVNGRGVASRIAVDPVVGPVLSP